MAVNKNVKARQPKSLEPEREQLTELVFQESSSPELSVKVDELMKELQEELGYFAVDELLLDSVRPAHHRDALRRVRHRLDALCAAVADLNDVTGFYLNERFAPEESKWAWRSVGVIPVLEKISAALAREERAVKQDAYIKKDSRHAPTLRARAGLILRLIRIFNEYDTPGQLRHHGDATARRRTFIRTVLETAEIPCPEDESSLQTLIDQNTSRLIYPTTTDTPTAAEILAGLVGKPSST